ncbi:hypothetical protein KI387_030212, partial [Taxus chinensis]
MQMNLRIKDRKKGFNTIIKRPPVYRKLWRPKITQSEKHVEAQKEKDIDLTKGEEAKKETQKDQTMILEKTNPIRLNMEVDEVNEKLYIHLTISNEEEMKKITHLPHQELITKNRFLELDKRRQGKDKELMESIARDLNKDKEFADMEDLTPPILQQLDFDKGKEEGKITPTLKKNLSECDKDGFIIVR